MRLIVETTHTHTQKAEETPEEIPEKSQKKSNYKKSFVGRAKQYIRRIKTKAEKAQFTEPR